MSKRTAAISKNVQHKAIKALLAGTTMMVFACSVSAANALSISNGSLSVDIGSNGAIDTLSFGGSDFYNPGTPVSNFGFQLGTDTSTFRSNTTTGSIGTPVSVSNTPGSVSVVGSYMGIGFTRSYSLVDGLNVLRITTDFTNTSGTSKLLSYFDTFDPDQGYDKGNSYRTTNDVFSLTTGAGDATVGQATETGSLSVVMGSLFSGTTVASGNPFAIRSGSALNNFFSSPFDGNGSFADSGLHIGVRSEIAAGGTFSFSYDQGYGTSSTAAKEAFIAANPGGSEDVPEPMTILGTILAGGYGIHRKRKNKLAASADA